MTLDEIVGRFEKPKRQGANSYQVICPCHNDKKASLSISNGKEPGKIVLHCHAGCETKDILSAVGLTMADLGEEKKEKKELQKWQIGLEERYDYQSESGRYLYTKLRYEGKKIRYARIVGDRYDVGRGTVEKSLYNLPSLLKAVKAGIPVYFVEGEKDVETLKKLHLTATTCGGAQDWNKEFAQYFIGAKVIILPDNDEPGQKLAEQVSKDLRNYAHSRRIVKTSTVEKGDVTDYINEGHTKEELQNLVSAEPAIAAPWLFTVNQGKENEALRVNEDLLAESILKTMDYIILKEQGTKGELFYVFRNGVYSRQSKNEIKALARRRIPFGIGKDEIFNKTANLLMYSGGEYHNFNSINSDERIINVKNGMYDIKMRQLKPHDPKVLSTIQLNCSYPEEYREPVSWVRFINELCIDEEGKPDIEMSLMLQEWTGLMLSNIKVQRFKKCLILHSLLGNTGKSQYLSTLVHLLGIENTANIPLQKMADRWSVGEAYGKRLIAVGDQNAYDIEDSSVFKQFTGGDAVHGEIKNEMAFSYIYNGGITIACNDLPAFKDDKGGHIFERLLLAHCRNVIPPEKRDGELIDKIIKEKDQVFRWALIGLHRLIENDFKFTACSSADELMDGYRSQIDSLYRFIDDTCERISSKSARIKKTEFEDEYLKYCGLNGLTSLHKKNIKERAQKNGIELGKVQGDYYYKGVKWKDFILVYDPNK